MARAFADEERAAYAERHPARVIVRGRRAGAARFPSRSRFGGGRLRASPRRAARPVCAHPHCAIRACDLTPGHNRDAGDRCGAGRRHTSHWCTGCVQESAGVHRNGMHTLRHFCASNWLGRACHPRRSPSTSGTATKGARRAGALVVEHVQRRLGNGEERGRLLVRPEAIRKVGTDKVGQVKRGCARRRTQPVSGSVPGTQPGASNVLEGLPCRDGPQSACSTRLAHELPSSRGCEIRAAGDCPGVL